MSNQPQQKPSQIVKILQRENVISFKKKPKIIKDNMKSQNNNEEQDTVSAHSSHSGVYSEDVNRFKGKINPLPQLGKEKKRFITKNLLTQQFRVNNYQQKEVRQQQNLMLKQKNNFLSSENMKLKTKISALEKENIKLQKAIEQQPSKAKTPGFVNPTKQRFRPAGDNLSTKILLKSLKKQLQDLKKQNNNIKSSIKFTTITELQCERDAIMQQTNRLRAMLEEQQNRRLMMRINQQGMSNMQQKLSSLNDKNSILMRENQQLKNKLKNLDENQSKGNKNSQNQKNLTKTLYNVRRLLKEKQRQNELLKEQIKISGISSINSYGVNSQKNITPQNNLPLSQGHIGARKPSMQRGSNKNFQKRIVSKSAQKNGQKPLQKPGSSTNQCQKCKILSAQNDTLKKKIAEYESAFQSSNPLALSTQPVECPKKQQIQALTKFIEFRFKAHHLTLAQSEKYLLNSQNITPEQLQKQITVEQFLQIAVTQPFVILNKRYIEVFIMQLCYTQQIKKGTQKIKIDKDMKIKKQTLLDNYRKLMPVFELLPQSKEQEMFLQIAQLVTSYYQQILAAMSNRKNGQGTISQKDLSQFFTEIQLEKEYIDFIITQIILESIDLEKLNYFAFFQIFYIPQEEGQTPQNVAQPKKGASQAPVDKKKRFQVDHVVKQQDEEYEESRSQFDQSRQKTVSKHADQSGDSYQNIASDNSPSKSLNKNQESDGQGQYEKYGQQEYEEENQVKSPEKLKQQKEEHIQMKPQKKDSSVKQIKEKKKQDSPVKQSKEKKKQKSNKKKTEKDDSYVEEFQEQRIDDSHDSQKHISPPKGKPGKLVDKPYEIQDIEAQYDEEFQN